VPASPSATPSVADQSAQAPTPEPTAHSSPTAVPTAVDTIIPEAGTQTLPAGGDSLSANDRIEITGRIRAYFDARYRSFQTLELQSLDGFTVQTPESESFLKMEKAKLMAQLGGAKACRLAYSGYEYTLDYKDISVDEASHRVTVSLAEGHDVVYQISDEMRPENPIVSKMRNLAHTIVLERLGGTWKIVSDTYQDELWRTIRKSGWSAEQLMSFVYADDCYGTNPARPFTVPTPGNTIVPQFEGYYMGTVVIAGYYTLLEKELYADAYALLSASQQSQYGLPQYAEMQRDAGRVADIVTVQPVRAKAVEEHSPLLSQDTANAITFYVEVRLSTPGTSVNSRIQAQYLGVTKEGGLWKIGASSTGLDAANPTLAAPPTIDPALVSDVSYYDSLVRISEYYTLFSHGFYKDAYDLNSSLVEHPPTYENLVTSTRLLQIKERRIVAIYPLLEATQKVTIDPTPDPMRRRDFLAQLDTEGVNGMAESVTIGGHT